MLQILIEKALIAQHGKVGQQFSPADAGRYKITRCQGLFIVYTISHPTPPIQSTHVLSSKILLTFALTTTTVKREGDRPSAAAVAKLLLLLHILCPNM